MSSAPLAAPLWPPVSDATAERLKAVYLSRDWSFNASAESAFAREFAARHDARHGIFMVNGTVTLECALRACGVKAGDEVIVPAITWMATAMAVHYLGAVPVFVDVEPTTLCMDPAAVASAITSRTTAIMPVHLFGSMADLDALMGLARKHHLLLIEDCAHMQGGKWNGRGAGSWGAVGSFSFQQSKTLASGEGGLCITSDEALADRIYRLKHIGYPDGSQQGCASTGPPPGLVCHNYRSTAFEATILRGQLEHLDTRIRLYNTNYEMLASYVARAPGVRLQERGRRADPQGFYGLVLIMDGQPLADIPREAICRAALAEGVKLGHTFGPVYRHILYNMPPDSYRIAEGRCPVTETIGTDRAFMLHHAWLGSDAGTIHAVGEILVKLANNADALRALAE